MIHAPARVVRAPARAGVPEAGLPSADAPPTPLPILVTYGIPLCGIGSIEILIHTYLLKFATDVLLVAPAMLGTIFFVGRIWDAFSDPLVGYLSDRTKTRWGRRRPWFAAAILPIAVAPLMVWSPPPLLEGAALAVWLAVGIIAFETASTCFYVPHAALGAELSADYHDRTRIFGARHVARTVGLLVGGIGIYALIEAEDKRGTASQIALWGGLLSAALITYAMVRLREPLEHVGRGPERALRAMSDVLRNPHARLLAVVFFIEFSAFGSLAVLGPFYMQYIVGDESLFPLLILAYLGPALVLVPLAVRLSRLLGKKRAWLLAMGITSAAFGSLFFVTSIPALAAVGVCIGLGLTMAGTVGPSVQADVIDWDEHRTGERKEGSYYATWNFLRKCSSGFIVWVAGISLSLVGFEPNAPQTEEAQLAIRALFAGLPCVTYLIGLLVFWRFRLTEEEHRRVRTDLDARAAASARAS